MKVSARQKLKLKILGTYGTAVEFCKVSGYTGTYIKSILAGKYTGTDKFWGKTQELLGIPDEELWSYKRRKEVK